EFLDTNLGKQHAMPHYNLSQNGALLSMHPYHLGSTLPKPRLTHHQLGLSFPVPQYDPLPMELRPHNQFLTCFDIAKQIPGSHPLIHQIGVQPHFPVSNIEINQVLFIEKEKNDNHGGRTEEENTRNAVNIIENIKRYLDDNENDINDISNNSDERYSDLNAACMIKKGMELVDVKDVCLNEESLDFLKATEQLYADTIEPTAGPYIDESVNSKGLNSAKEKKKAMTSAERVRAYRARKSTEALKQYRERDRIRKAASCATLSEEQRQLKRERRRISCAAYRAAMTEEKKKRQRELDRIRSANSRKAMTEMQKIQQREQNRIRNATSRKAAMTEEKKKRQRELDRIRSANSRKAMTEMQKIKQREQNRIRNATSRKAIIKNQREKCCELEGLMIATSEADMTKEKKQQQCKQKNVRITTELTTERNLRNHNFLCEQCGERFKSMNYMLKHLQKHLE
ncbi:unnamed protein product, partial [Meganyctiphanes norvegica]